MCIPKKSKKSKKETITEIDQGSDKDSDENNNNNSVHRADNNTSAEHDQNADVVRNAIAGNSFKKVSIKCAQNSKAVVEAWVQRALDIGVQGLLEEFRELCRWKADTMTLTACEANKDKNRYNDVPCTDNRRVTVSWNGLPNDYIHANYVATPNSEKRFICTQGPLESTQLAFWAMTVQEGVQNIIMLCNIIENKRLKCTQYYPLNKDESMTFGEEDDAITVTNIDVHPMSPSDPSIRVCHLKMDWREDGRDISRKLTHYQWQDWPDRGVPKTKLTATALLSEVRGSTGPILVHCSAGIGRTGTIAAIAYVQERMQHGQCCIAMPELLKELRTQRAYSIQTELQYIYLHRVLLAYFLEKYRSRFASTLNFATIEKYAKWCEDYKAATGSE